LKTIKPDKLGILHRVFENVQRCFLAIGVLVGASLRTPRSLVSEVGVWKVAGEELEAEGNILDEAFPKSVGEVLISGKAFTRGGGPATATVVRARIGTVDKRIAVFGDRVWHGSNPSPPAPFTEMPLDWSRAFGGPTDLANPLGKGASPIALEDGTKVHPLPNLELPDQLISERDHRPPPASFGALDLSRMQRRARAGTYDRAWLEQRSPGLPVDFDLRFFNAALPDQWNEGFFRGDEEVVLENMHPTEPVLTGALPGLVTRAFVVFAADVPPKGELIPKTALREVALRVDTVRLFPHRDLAVAVHRGTIEVGEDDADDVAHLIIAAEDPTAPRDLDHYHRVLLMRLDVRKYPWALTRDSDLMPPAALGWDIKPDRGDIVDLAEQESLVRKNVRRGADAYLEGRREELTAKGLWQEPPPAQDDDDMDLEDAMKKVEELQKVADQQRKEANERADAMRLRAREAFARQGIDLDAETEKAKREGAGPPKFKARQFIEQMTDVVRASREAGAPMPEMEAQLADPAWQEGLVAQEQALLRVYRTSAHHQDPAGRLGADGNDLARAEIVSAKELGASLAGRDFTGVDLSGLDLSGIDLSDALLESADLTATVLLGAKLRRTVLAHATLAGTVLKDAVLTGANLGGATIDGADLTGADLTDVLLTRARLDRVRLAGARLVRTQLLSTVFGESVDLAGARGSELFFYQLDLRGCSFAGAVLERTNVLESDLTGCDLSGADLRRCGFLECRMDGANLGRARLDHAQLILGTTLVGARLEDASGLRVNLREAKLHGATLTRADLTESDLSKADLGGADLRGAVLRGALLARTDFTGAVTTGADFLHAVLGKATLVGTDMRGASLFGTDLTRVRVDGATQIDRADLRRARVHPKRKEGGSFGGP
jgi:uncharacterized protein YjbI with pentapeptide repeats